MTTTIEDVAQKASVSISTVSRVVNRPDLVSEKTRQRVERAIERLAYRPNAYAQGLMRSRSNLPHLGASSDGIGRQQATGHNEGK